MGKNKQKMWEAEHKKLSEVNPLGSGGLIQPFQHRSPVFGTNYLEIEWFVPNNGAAVLKGLRGGGAAGMTTTATAVTA